MGPTTSPPDSARVAATTRPTRSRFPSPSSTPPSPSSPARVATSASSVPPSTPTRVPSSSTLTTPPSASLASRARVPSALFPRLPSSPVNNMKTGAYTVTYSGNDHSMLKAVKVTRGVVVYDTIKPVLKICTGGTHAWKRSVAMKAEKRTATYTVKKGEHAKSHTGTFKTRTACLDHHIIQHSAGYTRDIATIQHLENGARAAVCTDTCFYGKCTQARKVTTTWHTGSCNGAKTTFDTLKPAKYFIRYS